MKKKLIIVFFVAACCLFFHQRSSAQSSTVANTSTANIDSLKKMLQFFQTKKPGKAFQKLLTDTHVLLQTGKTEDTLATRLLELQDTLFRTQLVNKRTLLQYTLSVVNLLRQCSQISRRILATGLNALANAYETMGDFEHPGPLYEEALAIIKNSFGVENIDYADLLMIQGLFYADVGRYDKALLGYQQAEETYKKLGLENIVYAYLLNSEALLYVEMGRYEKALPTYEKALDILRKNSLEETSDYAGILNNVAKLYSEIGLYQEAVPLYEKVIALDKKNFPEETPDQARSIYNFGKLYSTMGRYEKALPMYQKALSIVEKELGKNNDMYAGMLDNRGGLYQNLGQYAKAEALTQEALRIKEKVLGKKHVSYAKTLNNLAALYQSMGQHQRALELLQQALHTSKELFGVKHHGYASALKNLGAVYASTGLDEKAFPLLDSALQIRKEVLGENHPDYATSLSSLAGWYEKKGLYADALNLYQQTLRIRKTALGETHPEYATTLNDMGMIHSLTNDNRKAVDFLSQSFQIRLQNISTNFTTLSEDQKLKLFFTETPKFHLLPSVLLRSKINDQAALNQLYTSELVLKGMVLQDQQTVLSAIRKSNDSTSLQQYEQWKFLRKLVGQQVLLSSRERRSDLDSLQNAASTLEQSLSRNSSAFRQQQQIQSVTVAGIAQNLSEGQAAIEFIRFNLYPKKSKDSTMYAALIVFPQDTAVRFVPLFEEKQLHSLLQTPSGQNTAIFTLYPDEKTNPGKESALYNLVWKPLEKQLKGVHTVFYAPTGLLHRIAFGALRKSDKHLLIDDCQLNQLFSTRTIAASGQQINKPAEAILWGDIQYRAVPPTTFVKNSRATRRGAENSFNLYAGDRGYSTRSPWSPLPETKTEIKEIRKVLTNAGINASTISGARATEEAFKALDGKNTPVLHVATHGFFLPLAGAKSTYSPDSKGDNTFTVQQNPMYRSGLVLAGANQVWSGQAALPGKEDGILTAYEISQMDLS